MRIAHRAAALGVALIVAGVLGVLAWRRAAAPGKYTDAVRYRERAAQPLFRSFDYVRVDEPDAVRSALDVDAPTNTEVGGALLSGARLDAALGTLHDDVARLIELTYGEHDPEEYIEEREALGYRFLTRGELKERLGLDTNEVCEAVLGRPASDFASEREIFVALRADVLRRESGEARLVGIASEEGSVQTVFNLETRTQPSSVGLNNEKIPMEDWYGGASVGCSLWIAPPISKEEVLDRDGTVLVAATGVVGRFKDGRRHPMVFLHFRDPTTGRWWLYSVIAQNTSAEIPCPMF